MKEVIDNTTKIILALDSSSTNKAGEFVKKWGEKSELKSKILFRLTFAVNEVVDAIIHLSEVLKINGNIEIEVEPYQKHITTNITFPKQIPLDPSFDDTDDILDQFPGMKISPDIFWHNVISKWVDKATWTKSSINKTTISLSQYARSEDSRTGELYFLSLKPKPAKGLTVEFIDDDIILAKSKEQKAAVKLNGKMIFVLKAIDGKTNVRDIYYSLVNKYGFINPKILGHIIEDLAGRNLIDIGKKRLDVKKESTFKILIQKILKFQYSIPKADKFTENLNRKIGWLWGKKALYFHLVFVLFSIITFSQYYTEIKNLAGQYFNNKTSLGVDTFVGYYLGIMIIIIFHEFSHAIVCKRYGAKVNEMGMMFYYASVCFYADTTDAWMLKNKWHRVMISLAGPINTLVMAMFFGWALIISMHLGNQNLSMIFAAVFLIGIVQVFINLIPFIDFDGYYILMDILEIPNLRKKSFSYSLSLIKSIFNKKHTQKHTKKEAVIFITFTLFAIITVAFLFFSIVNFVIKIIETQSKIYAWILGGIILALFFEKAIKAGLKWYKSNYLAPIDLKIKH